ncbi:MAG: NAD(P)-dependent glycerol-3-phosphate dehydrogenase [Lachnospiraceae bacterium]|nr:NAD(P)-dependent glycerol-3-phosphate dehydrogenase [Lachnospiraceae bacterium]
MKKNMNITILGAGGWSIALAVLLEGNGHNVTIWSKLQNEVDMLNEKRENSVSLPGVIIPESINITSNLESAVKDKDILVMATASRFVRSVASSLKGIVPDGQIIVNVSKGIEEATLMTLSKVISDELTNAQVAVLYGPSHAEEVSKGLPTACVAAAENIEIANLIQNTFMSRSFRIYTSTDVTGVELGGSLKNVIALAAGMADGIGFGDNSKAALITRGLAEMKRLGVAMGAHHDTITGLSGIGDLIVTCASMHSRNRRAGILMGKGYTMDEAMKEVNMVVEGVYSAKAALELGKKYNVSLPIIEQVNKVLFEGKTVEDAVVDLMIRDKTSEITN